MPLPAFQYIRSSDADTERLQQSVREALRGIVSCPLLDGVLVEDVALTTSFQDVPHGLQREPIGAWILSATDAAALAIDKQNVPQPSTLIRLKASVACTATLWVF